MSTAIGSSAPTIQWQRPAEGMAESLDVPDVLDGFSRSLTGRASLDQSGDQ